ncbi:MAG: phenylalanine--tRNA ligase subunit alpha [Deltaproteobacteria bacterium CG11_big_fil_rev_8_21_14_0_20_47_16]|nr:MAG: phenylalanine--tRNA ligase subunit alpha [Deltaproteobacteria bacterium CG11_big_fil_rev_8_21_14_0_20_47_16]
MNGTQLLNNIAEIRKVAEAEIAAINTLDEASACKVKYLGKKGLVTSVLQQMRDVGAEERPKIGQEVNRLKSHLEDVLQNLQEKLNTQRLEMAVASADVDVTLPGRPRPQGALHPITRIQEEALHILRGMGFSVAEGPECETDYYNFTALNFLPDHPARDMQDTFYVGESHLLRTHTSPVQIRVMEKQKPPLAIVAPGAVYRRDADVTHSPMFHQIEGLLVDKDVRMTDLKGVLTDFLQTLFGKQFSVRFRPSFFPFTEPSTEVDIQCVFCTGKGCRICKQTGWLEIMGAGMVDPEVFKSVRYDPNEFSGFAFGMGLERMAMLKYHINDIRLFFESDLRFLKQFIGRGA